MENEYKTADLGEASMLLCKGFILHRLDPGKNERQRSFVFLDEHPTEDTDRANLTGYDYKRRKPIMVDAYQYFLSMKEIKSRLYDEVDASAAG